MILRIIQIFVNVIRLSLRLRQMTLTGGLDNSRYRAQPHPIIVYCYKPNVKVFFSSFLIGRKVLAWRSVNRDVYQAAGNNVLFFPIARCHELSGKHHDENRK